MEKVLVLGSCGFLGNRLVSELIKSCDVVGYDRLPASGIKESERYHYVCGNFTEEQNFKEILLENKITAIYHLISTTTPYEGTTQTEREIKENIIPTVRLLDVAVECGVNKIIFASSGGTVYGDNSNLHTENEATNPICSYGVQKMAIEAMLRL